MLALFVGILTAGAQTNTDVHVLGEMRRMFTEHDIAPHVDLSTIVRTKHVYALGPLAGLQGKITVLDGQVFVSRATGANPKVTVDPNAKSIFLVYASVPVWDSRPLPADVEDEKALAAFLVKSMPRNARSTFLVRGTARAARYHIQAEREREWEVDFSDANCRSSGPRIAQVTQTESRTRTCPPKGSVV
jgi:hypothetical protein